MAWIDVHILTLPNTNQQWFKECLASLDRQPVRAYLIDGIQGSIGLGRIKGFSLGKSPYVSYVDPDDIVVPGIFEDCLELLANNTGIACVYTKEVPIDSKGRQAYGASDALYHQSIGTRHEIMMAHHLCVFRREAIKDLLFVMEDKYNLSEFFLKIALWESGGSYHFLDKIGYFWRRHGASASLNMRPEVNELRHRIGRWVRYGLDRRYQS